MIATWQDLHELRQCGKKPALPVVVTDRKSTAYAVPDNRTLVIFHEPGRPMPVHLMVGLDVLLMFDNCDRAAAVSRLLKKSEVQPARVRAWCECEQDLTVCGGSCADMVGVNTWIDSWRPAA